MQHALVTGSTGCLGLNLVEQLSLQGWRVWALRRASSNAQVLRRFKDVEEVVADLTDRQALLRAMPPAVDVIFHTAADTSMWSGDRVRQERVNVGGTENIIAAARQCGARLVHTSTWATFGLEHREISEATPATGGSSGVNYVRTKWLAEERVRGAGDLRTVIMHPSHIVGRYDGHNWIRMIEYVLRSSRPIVPPGFASYCHAQEAARAHIVAAERAPKGRSYLLGGADASFADVARVLGEVSAHPVRPRVVPAFALRIGTKALAPWFGLLGRRPQLTPEGVQTLTSHARIVSHRAEGELDYRPASLEVMLQDAYAWWRQSASAPASK